MATMTRTQLTEELETAIERAEAIIKFWHADPAAITRFDRVGATLIASDLGKLFGQVSVICEGDLHRADGVEMDEATAVAKRSEGGPKFAMSQKRI